MVIKKRIPDEFVLQSLVVFVHRLGSIIPLDHPPNLSISLVLVNCIAVLALIFLISFYNRIYYIDSFFINQLQIFLKKEEKMIFFGDIIMEVFLWKIKKVRCL